MAVPVTVNTLIVWKLGYSILWFVIMDKPVYMPVPVTVPIPVS